MNSEYLLRIKAPIDCLFSIGHFAKTREHVDFILKGLPKECDAFISPINSCLDPYTISDIEYPLLAHKARLEKHQQPALFDTLSFNLTHAAPKEKAVSITLAPSQFPVMNQFPSSYASDSASQGFRLLPLNAPLSIVQIPEHHTILCGGRYDRFHGCDNGRLGSSYRSLVVFLLCCEPGH